MYFFLKLALNVFIYMYQKVTLLINDVYNTSLFVHLCSMHVF